MRAGYAICDTNNTYLYNICEWLLYSIKGTLTNFKNVSYIMHHIKISAVIFINLYACIFRCKDVLLVINII